MKYQIMSFSEAMKRGFKEENLNELRDNYRQGIFEMEGDRPVKMLGCDGGEPEDQTLGRDWNWVMGALNEAHQKGFRAAQWLYEQ